MHELSIAEEMLRVIGDAIGGSRPLGRVSLVVGPLSGVSADSLRFCMAEMAREQGFGTPEIDVSEPPARVACRSCGAGYEPGDFYDSCPLCGSPDKTILSGRECTVESVDLLEEPSPPGGD